MSIRCYRDLKVWQESIDLVADIYKLSRKFPKQEIFGLSSQLQRAAVSVPSNIAEGHARNTNKEFSRFLSISLGSLAELETQLVIAGKLNYLSLCEVASVSDKTDYIGKMIRNLQKKL